MIMDMCDKNVSSSVFLGSDFIVKNTNVKHMLKNSNSVLFGLVIIYS